MSNSGKGRAYPDQPPGEEQRRRILDQFTRQAGPYSSAPAIQDADALRLLVELAGAGPEDLVLDVACGPGHVTAAFARVARRAAGIDVTPAMVERARALAREQGLANLSFEVGDVLPLHYPDGAFTIVVSRYSFHHFLDPLAVLREMRRVAGPGGKVLVADVCASPEPRKAEAYNRMEKLRDPSHVRGMTIEELRSLFARAGLPAPRAAFYDLEVDLEGLLQRSFPADGGAAEVRRMVLSSLADDGLGMKTRRVDGEVRLSYPIAILMGR